MQDIQELPPIEILRELFSYDPEEGVVRWKPRPLHTFAVEAKGKSWNTRYAGTPGSKDGRRGGYVFRLIFEGVQRTIQAHRIAWALVHGITVFGGIDHKNIDPSDNRAKNLRPATQRQQNANRNGWAKNGLLKGVQEAGGRYSASAQIEGGTEYLGRFDTPEEAHAAFCVATHKHRGEFFHSGYFATIEEAQEVHRAALRRRVDDRAANARHEIILLVDADFRDAAAAAMRKMWSFKFRNDVSDKAKDELDALGLLLSKQLSRLDPKKYGHLRTA